MSSSKAIPGNGAGKPVKRALPSWMSARDDGQDDKGDDDSVVDDKVEGTQKKSRGQHKGVKAGGEASGSGKISSSSGSSSSEFAKLLDGVVFALSGFVNPERGILRSQALEMGAVFQPDWNGDCTLLVCAFPNTPKFRQVEADGSTIVAKGWITECYTKKKLVDMENFLMHVGKPWRKNSVSCEGNQDHETSQPRKPGNLKVKDPEVVTKGSTSSKKLRGNAARDPTEDFSPLKVKKWVMDDLKKTLAWLESQVEKPDASEIRNVAAEGILTCLQDAVDLLEKTQNLQQLTEQWTMVPHVVEEIIRVQGNEASSSTASEDLHKVALTCKRIYEEELRKLSDEPKSDEPKVRYGREKHETTKDVGSNSMDYDSDETIEMTEEEIIDAYSSMSSTIPST